MANFVPFITRTTVTPNVPNDDIEIFVYYPGVETPCATTTNLPFIRSVFYGPNNGWLNGGQYKEGELVSALTDGSGSTILVADEDTGELFVVSALGDAQSYSGNSDTGMIKYTYCLPVPINSVDIITPKDFIPYPG